VLSGPSRVDPSWDRRHPPPATRRGRREEKSMMAIEMLEIVNVFEGWGRFSLGRFRLLDGTVVRREIEDHGTAAAVLPFDAGQRTAVLIRQFRAPYFATGGEADLLETIAGRLERGERPDDGIRREALEEAGLALKMLEPLGCVATMPAVSTERAHLFLAPISSADRVGEGGGCTAEHERITVVEIALRTLADMVDAGSILELKTLFMVQSLRLRRPDLFT
jgi:nudix-type nucleoside diphosphatase (YffH/AdpP family)